MKWFLVAALFAGCNRPVAGRDDVQGALPSTDHAPRDAASAGDVIRGAPSAGGGVGSGIASPLIIVDAPMQWSDERAKLTLEYRRAHSDPKATDLVIDPHAIVLHFTGSGSARATRSYFDNVRIEAARTDLVHAGAVNVSSHFLVDRDGTIYRLQPETRFARHCIGLNHIAIGVENVGDGNEFPLTDAQVEADVALVQYLAGRFKITHLLGHQEVMSFRKHPYYVELDPSYKNEKDDPGLAFMARVRERVADLHLQGL